MRLYNNWSDNLLLTILILLLVQRSSSFGIILPKPATTSRLLATKQQQPYRTYLQTTSSTSNDIPTSTSDETTTTTVLKRTTTQRKLGSQELLMLPRQYGINKDVTFPSMNHVSCTIIKGTPAKDSIERAVQYVMEQHPLLYAYVEGDGEPSRRIDILQMVRTKDEPNPLRFVADNPKRYNACTDIIKYIDTASNAIEFEQSWQSAFQRDLDDGSWCNVRTGPLWKLEIHTMMKNDSSSPNDAPCAFLFSFNHAISDQSSANRLFDQILATIHRMEQGQSLPTQQQQPQLQSLPVSLEESVLGTEQTWNDIGINGFSPRTIQYVVGKATEGFKNPVILPDTVEDATNENPFWSAITIISGREAGGKDATTTKRKSNLQFRTLSKEATSTLLAKCHENKVTISNALTAAITCTLTDFIDKDNNKRSNRYYKILQSLDMRRYGAQLDKGTTVACMAGSHDLIHGPLPDGTGQNIRNNPSPTNLATFWKLAVDGKEQTQAFVIDSIGPKEATRVFDFAMSISDLNNLVYLTSQSQDTKGRAYSAGVTNVGVYERQTSFGTGNGDNTLLQNQYGRYSVQHIYYATPHIQSGCLYPVSCITVDGELQFTFNPVDPIVDEKTNAAFADAFVELLETVTETREQSAISNESNDDGTLLSSLPENTLTLVAAGIGLVSVMSHGGAWVQFFRSVLEMKANVADPADFWAALNFWIFFAAGHPLLPPVLWISDVLHGSPGPVIANLVPVSFVLGNVIAIAAITFSKQIRNVVNIAVFSAFLTYIGAGLDGAANLGDFNLALDDNYKGQIVKGCPAYEDVRQPSMDGFDLAKYQGKWYEHKFHDWTQFKEVYDTTLDIKLTENGLGWVDDFAVKGPSPDSAPLSWDKSPVANGAHYFLFGRVDPNDPPGILRESGFGVEFPNYIVDVLKDPKTGEYTEAIQFQCLERGGVRVFEGINFMSRNPEMTDAELAAMHKRAEVAGMYPYGASPEQMHRVSHRPVDAPPLDNSWQDLWRAVGVDKLLELVTQAIEDGGR